ATPSRCSPISLASGTTSARRHSRRIWPATRPAGGRRERQHRPQVSRQRPAAPPAKERAANAPAPSQAEAEPAPASAPAALPRAKQPAKQQRREAQRPNAPLSIAPKR